MNTRFIAYALLLLTLAACGAEVEPEQKWGGWEVAEVPPADGYNAHLNFGANDIWLATSNGEVLRWQGEAWRPTATGNNIPLHQLDGPSSDDIWAGGFQDTLLHWNGANWTKVATPFEERPGVSLGVWAPRRNEVYVTSHDEMWRFDGVEWKQQEDTRTPNRCGWWLKGSAAEVNVAYRWDASAWTKHVLPGSAEINAIVCEGDAAWAVGNEETLLRWNGLEWLKVTAGPDRCHPWECIWFHDAYVDPSGAIWAVGVNGSGFGAPGAIAKWNGREWERYIDVTNNEGTLTIRDIWGNEGGDLWAASDKQLFRLRRE